MRAMVLGAALLAFGCGSTEKAGVQPTSGGRGGADAAGGANAAGGGGMPTGGVSPGGGSNGSSGSTGQGGSLGLVFGDSPADGCIAYALAVCTRRDQCVGRPAANCAATTLDCPDLVFSPGATRTVDGLKACAQAYASLACDQVGANVSPACVTPGTRARGEKCQFASQCSSLFCKGDDACGACGVEAAAGESCAEADVKCVAGTSCDTATHKCQTDAPRGAPVPGAKLNESCADVACVFGAYCGTGHVCQPVPGANQPCASDVSGTLICGNNTVCHFSDATSGTCLPPPQAGEPCVLSPTDASSGNCGFGNLHCDLSTTPPVCKPPGKAGDECKTHNDCGGFALCECAEPAADCAPKHCVELELGNQACTAPNTRCHPAFTCTAGVCQPIALRGDFATACGP